METDTNVQCSSSTPPEPVYVLEMWVGGALLGGDEQVMADKEWCECQLTMIL